MLRTVRLTEILVSQSFLFLRISSDHGKERTKKEKEREVGKKEVEMMVVTNPFS